VRKKSIVMKNLKSLVSKANSGFAPRSSSKERFGLENFIAASSSEILMTRGGYDGPSSGNATNPFGASLIGNGINNSGPGGSIGSIGNGIAQAFSNMFGSYNDSSVGQFFNSATSTLIDFTVTAAGVVVIVGATIVEYATGMFFPVIVFPPSFDNGNSSGGGYSG
jgi:hypothetical protein